MQFELGSSPEPRAQQRRRKGTPRAGSKQRAYEGCLLGARASSCNSLSAQLVLGGQGQGWGSFFSHLSL